MITDYNNVDLSTANTRLIMYFVNHTTCGFVELLIYYSDRKSS